MILCMDGIASDQSQAVKRYCKMYGMDTAESAGELHQRTDYMATDVCFNAQN